MRYNDWLIAEHHKRIVAEAVPNTLRKPHLAQSIKGVVGKRITSEITAGVWMKPIGSDVQTTFSSIHDVDRKTLLVAVQGNTSRHADSTPPLFALAEILRTRFASRRVLGIIGELFSYHEMADLDIDDAIARKYDVMQMVLITRTREDR